MPMARAPTMNPKTAFASHAAYHSLSSLVLYKLAARCMGGLVILTFLALCRRSATQLRPGRLTSMRQELCKPRQSPGSLHDGSDSDVSEGSWGNLDGLADLSEGSNILEHGSPLAANHLSHLRSLEESGPVVVVIRRNSSRELAEVASVRRDWW